MSRHGEVRNIKSGQQVNIERVPLVTLPQELVMSLVGVSDVINLFILSYRGVTVIKFGQ